MKRCISTLVCISCFLSLAAVAAPPAGGLAGAKQRMRERLPQVASLKTAKKVGENRNGLLEILDAGKSDDAAQGLVAEENADRSSVYAAIAAKAGSTPERVGQQRARQIYESAAPGVMLQRADGSWFEKR